MRPAMATRARSAACTCRGATRPLRSYVNGRRKRASTHPSSLGRVARGPMSPPALLGAPAAAPIARLSGPALAAPVLTVAPVVTTSRWRVVARVGGHPAAWLARRRGVTLMRFDQQLVHVALHAGSSDGGTAGWSYGDRVSAGEVHRLIAAVNGGFKLTYADVGFVSGGHV